MEAIVDGNFLVFTYTYMVVDVDNRKETGL